MCKFPRAGKGGTEVQTVPGAWLDESGSSGGTSKSPVEGGKIRNSCVGSQSLVTRDHKSAEPAGIVPQPKAEVLYPLMVSIFPSFGIS